MPVYITLRALFRPQWSHAFVAPSSLLCHLWFLSVILSRFLVSSGPSSCPFAASRWAKLQEMVLLALERRNIISIWTSEANRAAEMKQGKLRCLKAFGNKERKHRRRDAEMVKTGACQWLSLCSPLTVPPPCRRITAVKCSLTQKCHGKRLHLQ